MSRFGLIAFASSLDQIGPFSRSVEDAAMMLQVIAGKDPNDSTSVPLPVPDYRAALTGEIRGMKIGVASPHLIPRQLDNHGLNAQQISFEETALKKLIREYTREAGLRNLEREIGSIIRKIARRHAEGNPEPVVVTPERVEEFLGALGIPQPPGAPSQRRRRPRSAASAPARPPLASGKA